MYHYVRPLQATEFPRLKALDLNAFRGQIAFLQRHHTLITPADLRAVVQGRAELPPRACLLTFDDGYTDHYRHVFPVLQAEGLAGLFFAPHASLVARQMLEVNMIQFTLAVAPDPLALMADLDRMLTDHAVALGPLRETCLTPNRYDPPAVNYIKRVLQHALAADLRTAISTALFVRHVTADAAGFAETLYLTPDQAREMIAGGMEFGGHGNRHLWHAKCPAPDLAAEVAGSVAALRAIGAPVSGAFYCYPFGNQDDRVTASVQKAGFAAGFTVEPHLSTPDRCDPFRIARLDTNDLPKSAQAEPTLWQALAGQTTRHDRVGL